MGSWVDERGSLLDSVLSGDLSPAQAEQAAESLGMTPFERVPSAVDYDPFAEREWSLVMAVAWIVWRTPDRVREFWDRYRLAVRRWVPIGSGDKSAGEVSGGYALLSLNRATPTDLAVATSVRGKPLHRGKTDAELARLDLWDALIDGVLAAKGRRTSDDHATSIAAEDWRHLSWYEVPNINPVRVGRSPRDPRAYEDVTVDASRLVSLWQPASSTGALPPLGTFAEAKWVTLFSAAHWIASEGGNRGLTSADSAAWSRAYAELLAGLSASELEATGIRDGERLKIPATTFIRLPVELPFEPAIPARSRRDDLSLRSTFCADEGDYQRGFGDSLHNRTGVIWSRVTLMQADVARHWPFKSGRTGTAGRPTSMPLILNEFRARCARGDARESLRAEAEALTNWQRKTHPSGPHASLGSVENGIRKEYRQWRERHTK